MTQTLTLAHGPLSARIAPLGAELQSLRRGTEELMWQPRAGIWQQTAPWLFPFVGRLRDGRYLHRGRWHEMPLHGFAASRAFEVLAHSADALQLQLRAGEASRACYPFEFRLVIGYRLDEAGLAMEVTVQNDSDETLPFAFGAHPGFALTGRLQDWQLQFAEPEAAQVWRLDPEPRPWGLRAAAPEPWTWSAPGRLALNAQLFERDALILDPVRSAWVAIVHKTEGERLRMRFDGAPQLGLWARPGAPYVCIEPWWGRDDDAAAPHELLAKPQVQRLPGGRSFTARMRITPSAT